VYIRRPTLRRNHTNAMSAGNLSRIPQFLMCIREFILERNPLGVMNVGKPTEVIQA
jgi:hypothetical protein